MNQTVQVAIAGAGKAGTQHAQAFSECKYARVVRVMSRTQESAQRLADAFGIPKSGTDFAEVCADPDVDAVVIASPDAKHFEQATLAARAGKHILVEKPMCKTEEEAAEIIETARTAGVVLMVGFVERFNQPCMDAKARIEAGAIGRPAMILARRCHQKKIIRNRKWLNDDETGGVLNYTGTHNIDLMCWLMGSRPVRVYAESGRLVVSQEQQFTDSAVMTVYFENGSIGCMYESFGYPGAYPHGVDRSIEILGDQGSLNIDLMRQPLTIVDEDAVTLADSMTWPVFQGQFGGAIRNQAEHFALCILEDHPVLAPGSAGLLSIQVANAARKAARTNQVSQL